MGLSSLEITGGTPLHGEISIQGSKNAVLPVLAACLPGEGVCVIENCPDIRDVEDTLEIMRGLGCRVCRCGGTVSVDASAAGGFEIAGEEAARIRSSVLFLGALLARTGRAVLPLPGGCAIGERPVDLHLRALGALGAEFVLDGTISAFADHMRGGRVRLPLPSVGATENVILASVTAQGETLIENAAREPEVDELCLFLQRRGADIRRDAEGRIRIRGVRSLTGARHRMRPDRIVAGTYLLAAAATGGELRISDFPHRELDALLAVMRGMGADAEYEEGGIRAAAKGPLRAVPYLETAPYPGFPTDLQSPLLAVLCRAEGKSCVCETIFENRFRTVRELARMGAHITAAGSCARIEGMPALQAAELTAPDLRGGAALVIAALQAGGRSAIQKTEYIERGYEDIVRDLRALGAEVSRGARSQGKKEYGGENGAKQTKKTGEKNSQAGGGGSSAGPAPGTSFSVPGRKDADLRQ